MLKPSNIDDIINSGLVSADLCAVAEKVKDGQRITSADALLLYEKGEAGFVGALANHVRQKLHGDITYFNRNFHIEPTNICVYDCKFCSYSRLLKQKDGQWELSAEQMFNIVKSYDGQPVTEVHIV